MKVSKISWRAVALLVVLVWGVLTALPNLLPESVLVRLPGFFPDKQVSLGLDLRGGSHLLLEVELAPVIAERLEGLLADSRTRLRRAGVVYQSLDVDGSAVVVVLEDATQETVARDALRELSGDEFEISFRDGVGRVVFTDAALMLEEERILRQALEVVRRRLDETGTREPVVRLQGRERILVQIPGLRDPERVKELLGRTARLTFHLTDVASDGSAPLAPGFLRMPYRDGGTVDVSRRVFLSGDRLTNAQATFQQGRPVVAFSFDSAGARRFGEVTAENVGQPFAVVLDGEVITAPVIQEAIPGGNGIISGTFTTADVQDLSLLLRAGALPAPLHIIEERSVGPGLGADSIRAGTIAAVGSLIVVMVLMFLLYGTFGLFANISLATNCLLILAALSLLQATLTLPGIAGIVLTLGMAVDANVLIFERLREEALENRGPMGAVMAGYKRALGTILDSNITTFLAALMLYIYGTGPVRGFAITLSIGLATSVFTAVVLTRGLTAWWVARNKRLPDWTLPPPPRNAKNAKGAA